MVFEMFAFFERVSWPRLCLEKKNFSRAKQTQARLSARTRPSLPGLQLQRPLLANDGKRVREVLLHILLHLRSTKSRTVLFQPVSDRVHNKIEREWKRGSVEESVGELRTSMPAMSIRSLTLNFWPISLSLGTQYSTMLLNWITDMKTSTVGVKPKPQLGLLLRLFLFIIWRGSPDRGIGPAPFHFLPTSSWYVLPWWAHWLGSQCPPRLPVFREPPATCAFSPEGEKLCWISNFNFLNF